MPRRVLLAFSVATFAFAAPAFADQFLLGFSGFDYHVALPSSTHYMDVGDQYFSLGYVTSVDPVLLGNHVDFGTNEFTYYMYNMTVQATFFTGTLLEADFSNTTSSRARFYQDPILGGSHGVYGKAPPNGTAPSTFTDGTIALGGRTYNVILTYDFVANQGSFSGSIDFDEGSDLAFMPTDLRTGWVLGAIAGNPFVPQGYDHQVSGQCQVPAIAPAAHVTWGAIKAMYR